MLGQILAVTVTVASLGPMEKAYSEYLGYKKVEASKVEDAAAKTWGAGKVSGKPYVLMQPESGAPHYIRFVETAPYPEYDTIKTTGWNAIEILVQDPDSLAAKLRTSPFKIVGEPRGLSESSTTKAMQAVGPSKELLYLTNPSGAGNAAKSPVDRFFIIINASDDLGQLSNWFTDKMGMSVAKPASYRLTVVNKQYGYDLETKHPIAMTRTSANGFSLELDQYPKEVKVRAGRPDDLPPGISMVTFEVESLDAVKVPFVKAPAKLNGKPYDGRRVAVIKGISGELFELVEAGKK